MSGLEKLRRQAEGIIESGEFPISGKYILKIADEIERDMQDSIDQLMHYANTIHKPFEFGESVGEWLDRWYLPRPVIDGEPVQFGEVLRSNPVEEVGLFESHNFNVSSIQYADDGCVYLNGIAKSRCERVKPDSIETLKDDMCAAMLEINCRYDCEESCPINEWLSRAENLFGGGER